jgi:hypothetical protein
MARYKRSESVEMNVTFRGRGKVQYVSTLQSTKYMNIYISMTSLSHIADLIELTDSHVCGRISIYSTIILLDPSIRSSLASHDR